MQETENGKKNTWPFIVGGVLLFEPAAWVALAEMDYSAHEGYLRSLRTGFWFVLGQAFVVPVGAAGGAVFRLLSIWLGSKVTWGAMLVAAATLVGLVVPSTRPEARLRHLLGEEALKVVIIERLKCRQSFNGGETYIGFVSGPGELPELVKRHRKLQLVHEPYPDDHSRHERFYECMRGIPVPKGGELWEDRFLDILITPVRGRIYFHYRESSLKPEKSNGDTIRSDKKK